MSASNSQTVVIVPAEPTEAMFDAGYKAAAFPRDPEICGAMYRAMIDAAPKVLASSLTIANASYGPAGDAALRDALNQIIVRADQRMGSQVSDGVVAIAKAALAASSEAGKERATVAFDKLADVHRGWCNYCNGDALVCLNAPNGGCSLRDYMIALEPSSATSEGQA